MDKDYNLGRFIRAQEISYPAALREIRQGRKQTHWMWYIFPQLAALGKSYNAKFYGIADLDEARAYIEHPVLGARLRELCEIVIRCRIFLVVLYRQSHIGDSVFVVAS